ncbi:hypothetical protein FSARC_10167 [Fusarium sarcochroum]|uniref:Uncharacterized protein n=1 Tax=Fusarium sarcochroum TaxID=1208366 RepID=A0A8H4TPH0_9HYPO|nr:hypothetical protein FSARC_10167 [Fusarium sarcochroum]
MYCQDRSRAQLLLHAQDSICAQPGCERKLVLVEGESFEYSRLGGYEWLCPEHSCKMRDVNGQCYKPRRDSNTQYCADHAPEHNCPVTGCTSDRTPGEPFCEEHTCQNTKCPRQTCQLGRDAQKCHRHQSCSSPGCNSYAVVDSDKVPKAFCANHRLCHRCDAIILRESKYCVEHKCNERSCNHGRDIQHPSTLWCRNHICSVTGCLDGITNPADTRAQNCSRHTCQRPGCLEQANDNESNSRYCQTHACINKACDKMSKIPSGLCVDEACTRDGCGAARDPTNFYYPRLCSYHGDEEDQSYVLSPGAWGTPRTGSTAGPFGSARRRPRAFPPPSPEYHYQPRYRDPYQAAEANRRYENMDREFCNSTPRRMPRWQSDAEWSYR